MTSRINYSLNQSAREMAQREVGGGGERGERWGEGERDIYIYISHATHETQPVLYYPHTLFWIES